MKRQRQEAISRALRDGVVRSQNELVELLTRDGFKVSQTTVSRDLKELGFSRMRDSGGSLKYSVEPAPEGGLESRDAELLRTAPQVLLSTERSGNIVVVKTSPGNAQGLAWALDKAGLDGIAGTVAGDDTILVVCSHGKDSEEVARDLMGYALGER
jgi:transcriptional regulator of arginine metabolism